MAIRVVFAEDNFLVRAGTAALLDALPEIDVVAVVADGEQLHAAVREHAPDAVLTDIRMPPTWTEEGIDAARSIRREHPDVGVVVLSQHIEAEYALALLRDGVAGLGYLLKERIADVAELVRALQEVTRGGSALDPKVVEQLVSQRSAAQGSALARLTPREHDVLREIAAGRSNVAIGRALFLSERAVEKHINAIFHKLGLSEESEVNRRVMAVLRFLDDAPAGRDRPP